MKKKVLFLSLLLLGFLFFQSSCELIDIFNDDPGGVVDNSRIGVLKSLILTTAENARGDCDNDDNLELTRRTLNELIDQLVSIAPQRTEAEKLIEVAGAWQQVWSDNVIANVPGVCFEAEDIYQVVSPDGFYWNIFQARFLGLNFTGYIRGEYTVEDAYLPTAITGNFFATGALTSGADLLNLAQRAENGEISRAILVPSLPINGDTGRMGNLYVDEDLRIVTDGRSAAESETIFVMRRSAVVE
jgi:hypothetical protein